MTGPPLFNTIVSCIIQAVVYGFGLVINIKVISFCWKERDTTTWQLHMANSIVQTVYWPLDLSFVAISNSVPKLSMYTEEWLCKVAAFIQIYGLKLIVINSLAVVAVKYIIIVHHIKARVYGNEKIQRIVSIIYFAFPLGLAIIQVITNDYDSYKAVNNCLGLERKNISQQSSFQKIFLCNSKESNDALLSENYTVNFVRQSVCVVHSALTYIINSNLPEGYIYYKIFAKMKRYLLK